MLSELFGGISYNKKNKNRNYMVTWRYQISLLVLKKIFHENKRNFVTPSDHVIIIFFRFVTQNPRSATKDAKFFLLQKLRFEIDYISLQPVVYLYHKQPLFVSADWPACYCRLSKYFSTPLS